MAMKYIDMKGKHRYEQNNKILNNLVVVIHFLDPLT